MDTNESVSFYVHMIMFSLYAAEAGSDFVQQNTTIVFPVGSPKGEIKCADIVIVNDGPNEEEEEIIVFADIIGPSTALFGGSLESSSGRITVKIDDDEEDRKLWLKYITSPLIIMDVFSSMQQL